MDPMIKGSKRLIMLVSISAFITEALIKNPNRGGRPPMFMNEIAVISRRAGCFVIEDLRHTDVIFNKARDRIVVETIKM